MGSSGSPVHCCRPDYPLSLCPVLQNLNVKDTLTFNQRCLNEDLTFIFSSFLHRAHSHLGVPYN